MCLKKNLNASKPSNQSKGLGGNIGCSDKNSTGYLKTSTVHTDGRGEFEGEFKSLLEELRIKRETTPLYTPQYNDVVERALGLLRDKIVARLRGMTAGKSDRL